MQRYLLATITILVAALSVAYAIPARPLYLPPEHPKAPTASARVIELTDANWQKEVIESDVPVLVHFTAEWCAPCKKLAPTIHKLAEQFQGKVKVAPVDLGTSDSPKNTKILAKFNVQTIPRVILFKGGEVFKDFDAGGPSEEMLVRFLEMALAKN